MSRCVVRWNSTVISWENNAQCPRVSKTRNHQPKSFCLPSTSILFLTWLTLRPWRWGWYIRPKRRLTFTRLHGVTSKKIDLFAVSAVGTSNPRLIFLLSCIFYPRSNVSSSYCAKAAKSVCFSTRTLLYSALSYFVGKHNILATRPNILF
jgi:hypothetical protein